MERFIQLNLGSDSEKAGEANVPNQERKEPEPPVISKRVNKMINRAAHKASTEFRRGGSGGIFSK